MKTCPFCAEEIQDAAVVCKHCGRDLAAPKNAPLDVPLILALSACGLLVLGVFLPIVRLPIVGSMNYFQNGRGDGVLVIGLALISVLLVLGKAFRGLWLTTGGVLATLLFTFGNLNATLSEVRTTMDTDLEGNPFRGLADMAMSSVQLEWGWIVLVGAAGMLLASAFADSRRSARHDGLFMGIAAVLAISGFFIGMYREYVQIMIENPPF